MNAPVPDPALTQPDPDGGVEMTDGEREEFRGVEVTMALRRAAEANYLTRAGFRDDAREMYRASGPEILQSWADATRPVLSAALDRQEIARALYEHHVAEVEWRDGVTLSGWADAQQSTGEWYLEQADGVIATVLGTDQ